MGVKLVVKKNDWEKKGERVKSDRKVGSKEGGE